MKKYLIILVSILIAPILFSSCFKSYLDKSPESGMTEADVFKKLANFKLFFLSVYGDNLTSGLHIKNSYPLYFLVSQQKLTQESLTDCSDMGRVQTSQTIKQGKITITGYVSDAAKRPIFNSMWQAIRICNLTLENISQLQADSVTINDYKAQAYFVRAYAHFELFRLWGRMPYIDKALTGSDSWDLPRLSNHETLIRIAQDMDQAAVYFKRAGLMRRDNPVPGAPGHLSNVDQARPNGVAAKAYKARALLYAASPLNNEKGIEDWKDAAKANWEAIEIAKQYGYELLTFEKYTDNYYGVPYTNEQLWGWYFSGFSLLRDLSFMNGVFGGDQSGMSGECPTQNFVDRFETKYGDPLTTQADRDAATAAGVYKEQDPYKNRDPRFYIDIIYNQADGIIGWTNNKAQIWQQTVNGKITYSELRNSAYAGVTQTGYYQRKRWAGQSVNNNFSINYTDPLIRLGELYLNYAEAANEAYGPAGADPSSTMTALQAVNLIRNRVGMPGVQAKFTATAADLRPRIKNERIIELSFEGHYYHDIRRWKDAPTAYSSILTGVIADKQAAPTTAYPTGFIYTRYSLVSTRQVAWKDFMYYWPFDVNEMYKMKNFEPNPLWN
jgi:starch-binding outer membrane protein, SusD/RagB family